MTLWIYAKLLALANKTINATLYINLFFLEHFNNAIKEASPSPEANESTIPTKRSQHETRSSPELDDKDEKPLNCNLDPCHEKHPKSNDKAKKEADKMKNPLNIHQTVETAFEQLPTNLAFQHNNIQGYQTYLGQTPQISNPHMTPSFSPNDYMSAFQRSVTSQPHRTYHVPYNIGLSPDCIMPRPFMPASTNFMPQLNPNYNGILPSLLYSQSWNLPQPTVLPKVSTKTNNIHATTK